MRIFYLREYHLPLGSKKRSHPRFDRVANMIDRKTLQNYDPYELFERYVRPADMGRVDLFLSGDTRAVGRGGHS